MALEIEHKFLVIRERLPRLERGQRIRQAYIPTSNGTMVRIRIADDQAILGIKTRSVGPTRHEFEFPIPLTDGLELLSTACQSCGIEKVRYLIEHDGNTWEVDVFEGENSGLIVAELELDNEGQAFTLPPWVSREVTLDPRYSNYNLASHPVSSWLDAES